MYLRTSSLEESVHSCIVFFPEFSSDRKWQAPNHRGVYSRRIPASNEESCTEKRWNSSRRTTLIALPLYVYTCTYVYWWCFEYPRALSVHSAQFLRLSVVSDLFFFEDNASSLSLRKTTKSIRGCWKGTCTMYTQGDCCSLDESTAHETAL